MEKSDDLPSEMEVRAYEERLRRRLEVLREELEAGNVKINSNLQVVESLKAVRYGSDGKIDLSTVDGSVRSMALAVEMFSDRRKLKEEISLQDIQLKYFEILDAYFRDVYNEMRRANASPHEVANDIAGSDEYRPIVAKFADEFLAIIDEFWDAMGPPTHVHLEDMDGSLKCVFGGDLFPSNRENIASKCGIYTDTIILPDPFLRSREMFRRANESQKIYYVVKHALNALQYKDLACADLSPPIVVIAPDYTALEKEEKEFVARISEADALFHAKEVFGREFSSVEEMVQFSRKLETVDAVLAEIKRPDRVLFDSSWEGSAREQIIRAQSDQQTKIFGNFSPGQLVAMQALGRMGAANELLIKARRLGGSPIIDAPTSWKYFNWKLEYDSARAVEKQAGVDLHVLKGLEDLSVGQLQWLGRVPPEALIEIRREGALPEIRQMLSSGIDELVKTNPNNFYRTTDKVFDNIHAAFEQHQRKIDALKAKSWKFATKDIGTWLVAGSIEIGAALTGTPAWGLSAFAINQLTDAVKLKDIPKSIKGLIEENRKLKRSPVGILFQYKTEAGD